MSENIFVSVIIPVFNDVKRLEICLKALENQTYPKLAYEVIVVDNGSTESPDVIVDQFTQASLTNESQPGSYIARNKGISVAKGEIIAFTDSDCIPAVNWIEAGVNKLLSEPKCGLVAGKIEMFFKTPGQPTIVEMYDTVTFLQQQKYIEFEHYGATANLFTFKKVIETVGDFNSKLKSGGDLEWGQRVFAQGYLQLYAEDCCVAHPARYSFSQIYKKITRTRGSSYDLDTFKELKDVKYSYKNLIKNLSGLTPPLRSSFLSVWFDKRISNKLKTPIFLFKLLVHYIRFWEEKRLQLGRISSRE